MLGINQWGPAGWIFLHVVSHNYPHCPTTAQKREMREFIHLFGVHLPCEKCRAHYQSFMASRLTEETLSSREALVALLNECHNAVNLRRGKRAYSLPEHYRAVNRRSSPPWIIILSILCITLATDKILGVVNQHRNVRSRK